MLSELRPVSYLMKTENNVEAKNLRFGFIAQEVEKFLPSMVKTHPTSGDKSIMYSDIIAVITMALQHELHLTESLRVRIDDHEERLVRLEGRDALVAKLEQDILTLKQQLTALSSSSSTNATDITTSIEHAEGTKAAPAQDKKSSTSTSSDVVYA